VGSDYWQFPSPDYVDVVGARVTAAGAIDAAPLPIATGPPDQVLVAIGSDRRDYLVVYRLSKMDGTRVLAAKRMLREGQLDGAVPSDDGTIIASVDYPTSVAVAYVGGYWIGWTHDDGGTDSILLAHIDTQGKPEQAITLASNPTLLPSASISLAEAPGQALQIAYSRRVTEGVYASTSRVFVRLAGDFASRSRAVRH